MPALDISAVTALNPARRACDASVGVGGSLFRLLDSTRLGEGDIRQGLEQQPPASSEFLGMPLLGSGIAQNLQSTPEVMECLFGVIANEHRLGQGFHRVLPRKAKGW